MPLRGLLPPSVELPARLREVHESPAPFPWPGGSWARQRLKQLTMVTFGRVGRNQREFNEKVRDTLTLMAAEVRGMRQFLEERAHLLDGPRSFGGRVDATERGLEHLQNHFGSMAAAVRSRHDRLHAEQEELAAEVTTLREKMDTQGRTLERHSTSLKPVEQELAGLQQRWVEAAEDRPRLDALVAKVAALGDVSPWVALLQRRMEAMALDLREIVARERELPAPRIVDGENFRRRLAEMGEKVRVNVGCGERPWPDYINVDWRELPDVDVVGDARVLPFEPGTVAELASSHLVEHFREHELRTRVLPYWKGLLRPGGNLRIICPNWQAMLQRLNDGRMIMAHFKQVTFGAQDYEGDDHFAMYTPDTLRNLLLDCGFADVEMVTLERMNGLCPEMEIVAHLSPVGVMASPLDALKSSVTG
jgi:predicted SAM-dependent methyltransferase